MKTSALIISAVSFLITLLVVFPNASFSEETKPVLTVKDNCVIGLVHKFEAKAGDFGKEEAVDLPIVPFNEKDYEIADPAEFAALPRDAFNYPKACTIFDEMRWEQEKRQEEKK